MPVDVVKIAPENPMYWALKQLGLTLSEFSKEVGFGKSYLIRVGQGRHASLGTNLQAKLYSIAKDKGIDLDEAVLGVYGGSLDLDEAYQWWVVAHRRAQTVPEPAKVRGLNPFARLVEAAGGVSRMSALLAAPDALVRRYAQGVTYAMPMPVMMALADIDYPHTEALAAAMVRWGEDHQ